VTGALQLSDPTVIEAEDGSYYAFGTGIGLPIRKSSDLLAWQDAGAVFLFNPAWVSQQVDAAPELWSPDVSFFGERYHLYYAASKQGSNRSCIGHATASMLPGPFEDKGPVLCSNVDGETDADWNAIHPNYIADVDGAPYLAFGSFYSGVKLVALDPADGSTLDQPFVDLAARPAQGGALEAPFVVRRCDYFYLFVSFDRCCDGVNSTYKIFVGRSKQLTGPYVDRKGVPMLQGGGTQVVIGDETWHGPGHSAVFESQAHWYEAHHAYYAGRQNPTEVPGQAYLRISELMWDAEGWPASGGP
jgi:arabinan endo-1,5-alpha-L-arabinosidase